MEQDHPFTLADGCLKCPQRVYERIQIVHGYGDAQARVMVIGTMPDHRGANQTGVPWTRSTIGQRMQVILRSVGLRAPVEPENERPPLNDTYLTYLVRCSTHADRAPTRGEVAQCNAYLWQEIALVKPQIIVPVGELPMQIICARFLHTIPGPIDDLHAQVFPAPPYLIVPSKDIHLIDREEALLLARVLAALLED